jgi:hypothetical protein
VLVTNTPFQADLLAALVIALVSSGCTSGPKASENGDAGLGDRSVNDIAVDSEAKKRNLAWVYELDPTLTPTPKKVALEGVADDLDGTLTSAKDADGVRRIKVFSCVDEGRVATGKKACTLRQLAKADADGNFLFDDVNKGQTAADDRAAEAMAYYHVKKAYDFVTSKKVGLFDRLPNRHVINGKKVPLTVVVNYRQPAPLGASELQRVGVAMYFPYEFGRLGLFQMQGLEGIEGDVLILGQGTHTDFAYGGEATYHEFGHFIYTALTQTYVHFYTDEYGPCHLNNALSEGIAETFAWLISGETDMGRYLDRESSGKGHYRRRADNTNHYPESITGAFLPDGQVISGANYDVYQALRKTAAFSEHDFARLVMKTLMSLAPLKGNVSYAAYADALLATLEAMGHGKTSASVRPLLQARGLYGAREKDITHFDGTDGTTQSLLIGGTGMGPGSSIVAEIEGVSVRLAATCVQTYVELRATSNALTLEAILSPDRGNDTATMKLGLLVRKAKPLTYHPETKPIKIDYDRTIAPTLEKTTTNQGQKDLVRFQLDQLEHGARYYLHVVNYGAGSGVLAGIRVTQ